MDRFAFSRFAEKRNHNSSDTSNYDEHVEGVEPEETASLDAHISESNIGYQLVQRMGWKTGTGLGKNEQGRKEPIPFNLKDDNMGLGRWNYELEQAQDATDKRRQLEIEKEITPDLVEKYKTQAEKEQKLAETILEMNRSFYCQLCDKQYFKYSEYDNHINSYAHHHRQRLRDLKQWESGRRFGGHRSEEDEREKERAAQAVAMERARMLQRRERRKVTPGFKPIGSEGGGAVPHPLGTPTATWSTGVKRSGEGTSPVSQKQARLAKYSLKFQSAGNLTTVGDRVRLEGGRNRGREYAGTPSSRGRREEEGDEEEGCVVGGGRELGRVDKSATGGGGGGGDKVGEESSMKFSFGFSKKTQYQLQSSGAARRGGAGVPGRTEGNGPVPPPLMSRRRELMTKAFGGDSDSEGEEGEELVKMAVRGFPRFRFQIRK